MAREKKQEAPPPGAPLYMATYGDMVTLILCFFVLLFAMSTIDALKFQKMVLSLRGSLGVMKGGKAQEEAPMPFGGQSGAAPGSAPRYEMDIQSATKSMQSYLLKEGLDKSAQVTVDQRGITVSMSDQFLFDSGSAELKTGAKRVLTMLASMARDVAPSAAVEGHTDSSPLEGGIYRHNWGLSAARAAAVASWLETDGKYPADSLQAVGFGSSKPIVPNDTPANRALNRRVDIVFLSQYPKG